MIMPEVEALELDLPEIQELDHKKVVEYKLNEAKKIKPRLNLIVEDLSLEIDGMNGLPGPFIKWFLKSLGREGIYEMAKMFGNHKATAIEILGYVDNSGKITYFEGKVEGTIVEPRGESDFGFDPIFVPNGQNKTYAEMGIEEKNKISHRRIALEKFKEFIKKDNMNEKEYHRKRRMFFWIDNKLVVPEAGSEKSHKEWLESNGRTKEMAKYIIDNELRGAINPGGNIIFYVGENMTLNEEIEKKFFGMLPSLVKKFNLGPETLIGGGVKIGKVGDIWPAIKEYGKVKDFLK